MFDRVVNVHVVKRFDNTLHLLGSESTEIRIDERSGTTPVKSHIFSRALPRDSVLASFTCTTDRSLNDSRYRN